MSYSSWKTAMTITSLAVSAGLGLVIFESDKGLNSVYLTVFLIPALALLIILSFLRPKVMWAVVTLGKSATTDADLAKNYGPFNSGHAAKKFAKDWNWRFEGFAVVEFREISKPKVDNS